MSRGDGNGEGSIVSYTSGYESVVVPSNALDDEIPRVQPRGDEEQGDSGACSDYRDEIA